jgi:hypothetical protein
VKVIENVRRPRSSFSKNLQVSWPHVGTGVLNPSDRLCIEQVKETPQTRLGPLFTHTKYSFAALIQLVHERQVVMATSMLDLINAN